ncbi:MAG: CBS domain-containing protein [Burkholderiales bacterium]|jgi:Mg2+/Co2+ transporter CorB|nr:CBS domain-containing protein [Burkholderiales bacterium]
MMTISWLLAGFLIGGIGGFAVAVAVFRSRLLSKPAPLLPPEPITGAPAEIFPCLQELLSGSVDDVMTPRTQIQALSLTEAPTLLRQGVGAGRHSRLPVYEGSLDHIAGILDLRDASRLFSTETLDAEVLRALLHPAYYIPAGTPLLKQVQQFQADRQHLGLVVDEYGELQGLVTLEDLTNEIASALTPLRPGADEASAAAPAIPEAGIVVDAGTSLRALNRRLGCGFPLDGPKTLSGLIVERLGTIPEAGAQCELDGYSVEILQTKQHAVRVVKLRLRSATPHKNTVLSLQTPKE